MWETHDICAASNNETQRSNKAMKIKLKNFPPFLCVRRKKKIGKRKSSEIAYNLQFLEMNAFEKLLQGIKLENKYFCYVTNGKKNNFPIKMVSYLKIFLKILQNFFHAT